MRSVENFSGEGDLMTIFVPQAPVHFGKGNRRASLARALGATGGNSLPVRRHQRGAREWWRGQKDASCVPVQSLDPLMEQGSVPLPHNKLTREAN